MISAKKKLFLITNLLGAIGILLFVAIDQITKKAMVNVLGNGKNIRVIKDVLELTYVENKGAAFGIMKDSILIFTLITVIFLVILIFYFEYIPFTRRYIPLRVLFIFIASGAIGNLIDRINYRYVRDFIYVKAIDFPVFNIADIYVTCAMLVLVILILVYYKEEDMKIFKITKKK